MRDQSMSIFKISIEPLNHSLSDEFLWCLDSPKNGDKLISEDILRDGLKISGWLLKKNTKNAEFVVLERSNVLNLSSNEKRPDVIRILCDNKSGWLHNELCGFKHSIRLLSDSLTIGLVHGGVFTPLYLIKLIGAFEVIRGANSWLFLDNDTNKSVEQYKGKLKLSWRVRNAWKEYMEAFNNLALNCAIRSAFMVVPSKEYVVSELYPHEGPKNTPLDQLQSIMVEGFPLLTLTETLKNMSCRAFRKCDTHWSAHGAMQATVELVRFLKIPILPITQEFEGDDYKSKQMGGDLGSKVFPPLSHEELYLTNYNYRKTVCLDNELPNFGRVIVFENIDAITDKTLVLFGSSSSYSMFNYLTRVFKGIVFFHTAGNIDTQVFSKLKPDYLVAQTNARFLVKAPTLSVNISSIVKEKLNLISGDISFKVRHGVESTFVDNAIETIQELHKVSSMT